MPEPKSSRDIFDVEYDARGNATINMRCRRGKVQMFIPVEELEQSPAKTVKTVIQSINDGFKFLEEDNILNAVGGKESVH